MNKRMIETIVINWSTIWKAVFILALLIGIYSFIIEPKWVEIKHVTVKANKFPADFKGLRVVLFSDTHLGFFFDQSDLQRTVEKINQLKPDVVCFTGDFLDSKDSISVLDSAVPILQNLQAPLGKFAILGNHDYRSDEKQITKTLQKGGFHVLVNQSITVQKDQQSFSFIGLDDVLHGNPDLVQAMNNVDKNHSKVLLVHEPDIAWKIQQNDIDLQLSGHSHAGQVRIPFVGPLLTSKLGKTYNAGLYQVGNLTVYTNRGLGTTILPVRFMARPEITVLTLTQ